MCRARPAGLALVALALAACGESGPGGSPRVVIAPILDSLFVDDTLATDTFTVTYFDAAGAVRPNGPVTWASSNTDVFRVDAGTGEVIGVGPGAALLSARANGVTGTALLVVSRVLDVALPLDTIILMPGDTFTVTAVVRDKDGNPPPVRFHEEPNPAFTIDSVTGRVTALVPGASSFTAHADTATASGVVEVVELTDTTGGKAYFTVLGSVIRRTRAGARAVNYRRAGDTATFRLSTPITVNNTTVENVVITLRDSVGAVGTLGIDSLSLQEAADNVFLCRPKRSWALWSTTAFVPTLRALSRPGGTITITKILAVPHGHAIGGRFAFTGRRSDLYDDPLAALPVLGTFVAPLITDLRPCRS